MSRALYRRKDLEVREVEPGGDAIVHDAAGGRLLVLNPVGYAVFELLDGTRDLEAITRALADAFGLDPEAARRDAQAFVEALVDHGAVERVAAP